MLLSETLGIKLIVNLETVYCVIFVLFASFERFISSHDASVVCVLEDFPVTLKNAANKTSFRAWSTDGGPIQA